MPAMANGGNGVYGRAESPYNADYLTAAFGSGLVKRIRHRHRGQLRRVRTGEGLGSSGRAPAASNALCAYTPSRGVISVRGNWPLVPTMDVVVPHTRTMADMFEVLDVVVANDPETRRATCGGHSRGSSSHGRRRCGPSPIPRCCPTASSQRGRCWRASGSESRGCTSTPMPRPGWGRTSASADRPDSASRPRQSVLDLFQAAGAALTAAGAEVVLVDFPVVSNYERDRESAPSSRTRGFVNPEFLHREIWDLSAWSWDDFLRANGGPNLPSLDHVDGSRIWVNPPGALPDQVQGFEDDINDYPDFIRTNPIASFLDIPHIEEGMRGLERDPQGRLRGVAAQTPPGRGDLPDESLTSARPTWTSTRPRPTSAGATASGWPMATSFPPSSASPPSPSRWA